MARQVSLTNHLIDVDPPSIRAESHPITDGCCQPLYLLAVTSPHTRGECQSARRLAEPVKSPKEEPPCSLLHRGNKPTPGYVLAFSQKQPRPPVRMAVGFSRLATVMTSSAGRSMYRENGTACLQAARLGTCSRNGRSNANRWVISVYGRQVFTRCGGGLGSCRSSEARGPVAAQMPAAA